jgi:small subunit ribosomal protein S14
MAKKSMIAREHKRELLIKKFDAKRRALKDVISSPNSSFEEKDAAQLQLHVILQVDLMVTIENLD